MSPYLDNINNGISPAIITTKISESCNISINDAMSLYKLLRNKELPIEYNCQSAQIDIINTNLKCLTCGSTNIKKYQVYLKLAV